MAHTLSGMDAAPKSGIQEKDLQGFKYLRLILPMLEELHESGCERDRAGNRRLHFDHYCALVLLYLFNPIISSHCRSS